MAPLLIGVAPFGVIFGVTVAASSVPDGLGAASSLIIFAGAAQFAVIRLLDVGAALGVVIATGLVINARHLMYSATLAPYFRRYPAGWRYALPYLLTDQAFVISIDRFARDDDPASQRWFFLGTALGLWATWQLTTIVGVVVGAEIPASWSLEFAIPLVFLALLVPSVKDRPGLVAAIVGGVTAVPAASLPLNLGLIVATLAGIAAGVAAARISEQGTET